MEKLVSVFLDVAGYDRKSGIRLSNADLHNRVQEHLDEYLSAGWTIKHLSCLPGSDTGGWVIAALQKAK